MAMSLALVKAMAMTLAMGMSLANGSRMAAAMAMQMAVGMVMRTAAGTGRGMVAAMAMQTAVGMECQMIEVAMAMPMEVVPPEDVTATQSAAAMGQLTVVATGAKMMAHCRRASSLWPCKRRRRGSRP